ncbi:stage II sporulation protein P [Caminicella sporogenes DSM 14501]|uniref:Stage II sporulation protein P n=1 Tax=Caminicella sporogenes DSM 14501 TaxID=1121266 RepID=A0A1M6MDL6_9FIRM|nr:stage II sporulation protein P [Caminicella sporogenes]RKD27595.1 hypothetical protein BET04_00555 [Caminicella sporogenes]SHJ81500.1 stage II sporulation protein P [Caminicella sporogenes DSM 14501]
MKILKKYDIIKCLMILITFTMIITGLNVILINEKVCIAKADDKKIQSFNQDSETFKKNIFIHIFNKSLAVLELDYKEKIGNNSDSFVKYAFNKIINFDYKNPKSYLKAQISLLKGVEDEIKIASKDSEEINSEDYDTSDIYIPEEYSNQKAVVDDEDYYKEPEKNTTFEANSFQIEKSNQTKQDKKSIENISSSSPKNLKIISTPVPPPEKIEHDKNKPLILIYHTHGTEAYYPEKIGNYHSLNSKYTVIRVGDILTKYLLDKGYKVIHDTTIHDYPSYQGSYKRSLQTMKKYIKDNPDLKIFIDIHRDGIDKIAEIEKNQKKKYDEMRKNSYIRINGEKVSRFALVVGGGNKNVDKLKRFAYYIKAVSDELYPGLSRPVILKNRRYNRYNQFMSNYCVLFEVGSNLNTIDESVRAAKYIGEVLDKSLKGFVKLN